MSFLRPLVTTVVLLAIWEALVRATGTPAFLLPPPSRVLGTIVAEWHVLTENALFTAAAMVGGLALGVALGLVTATALIASATVRRWILPLVVLSQAVPVFALAPLLIIWLGFDLPSKVAMVALVTYFPIALAFFEGMKRTDPGLLDLAALGRATRSQEIRLLRAPAALPALAAGLRGAAAAAPIGAIVGEWVGAAAGLGFLMIQANARMQTDMVFAALLVLAVMAITLWMVIDHILVRSLPWAPDSVVRG